MADQSAIKECHRHFKWIEEWLPTGTLCFLFGSRSREDFSEKSDTDFGIIFPAVISDGDRNTVYMWADETVNHTAGDFHVTIIRSEHCSNDWLESTIREGILIGEVLREL